MGKVSARQVKLGDEAAIHSVGTIGIRKTSFDMDYPVR